MLDRAFEAPAPNRKWIADFTYIWTAEGWLYVAAVLDLLSRRVVGWSMSATMTAKWHHPAGANACWLDTVDARHDMIGFTHPNEPVT